jgi:two-component system chemotaxis response regulator CheY
MARPAEGIFGFLRLQQVQRNQRRLGRGHRRGKGLAAEWFSVSYILLRDSARHGPARRAGDGRLAAGCWPLGRRAEERTGIMSKRLLIVDDCMLMRRMIAGVLTHYGWEVVAEATDGREAVEKYMQFKPDAVTLDIVMPGLHGMSALEQILQFDPKARVVVVSALNQTKLISEAIRRGAREFVAKPFLPKQLYQTMENCMEASLESS